jgi:chloramphenicol O-acetyltransferase type B
MNGPVTVGPMTVGRYSYVIDIQNSFDVKIEIGRFCSISGSIKVIAGQHPNITNPKSVTTFPFNELHGLPFTPCCGYDPITIGNDVWIGEFVSIKYGVTIGDGAVIGACSVVTKDVRPYEIVAGTPAKHIRFRFTQEQIDMLLRIKWWDWDIEKIRANIACFEDVDKFIEKFGNL